MNIDLSKPLGKLQGILVALLLMAVTFFVALIVKHAPDAPLESAVRLNTSGLGDVQVEGDSIYYIEAGSLHCVSSDGKFKWNVGVDKNSRFKVTGKGIAVWNGSRLRIVDLKTGVVLGNPSINGSILSAVVGDVYAAVVIGPEHNSTVLLTDLGGNIVDTLTDFKDVTVLDCGFFEGRELFWIMTLDSTGSLPCCKISTFKPGKRETGSITDMEQVIYKVMFRSSYICAVGTDYMRVYDYTGAEQADQRVMVYGWYLESMDGSGDNPLMLFVPNNQSGESMHISDIRCIKGKDEYMLHFSVACTQLKAFGDTVYGFSGDKLAVSTYGSTASNLYALPLSVSEVIGITANRTAVVISGNSIYMIKLPEK
jgi:hypothetical protein